MHLGWKALKYHSLKSESWISTLSRSRTSSSLEVELRASAWNMTFQAILYSSSIQNPGLIQGFAWQSLHPDMPDITPFSIKGTIKGFPFFWLRHLSNRYDLSWPQLWVGKNFLWQAWVRRLRTPSMRLILMVASQLPCFEFFVFLKWPLRSSDFLSGNCLNVGNCFAVWAAGSEGEGSLWLVWLVSEAPPTVLPPEDKDVSASTFAPQFGQKANDILVPGSFSHF